MKRISLLLRRIRHGLTAWSCCLFIHAVIPRTSQLNKLQRHAFAYLTHNYPWRWVAGTTFMKQSTSSLWIVFAIILIVYPVSLNAQKYNKYSDSYNFRKGMEALDKRESRKAEESFSREIEEHPENGYAYLYLAHLHFHNEAFGRALSSIDNAIKYIPKKDKEYKGACYYKRSGIYKYLEKFEE